MCGRYATTRSNADLSFFFEAVDVAEPLRASWNVAPTDPVPLIRTSKQHEGRVLDTARWGLVPHWAPDLRAGARMINARAETVATLRSFAPSFAKRRCLVPADGWFEWVRPGQANADQANADRASGDRASGDRARGSRANGKQKQAFYMTPLDGRPLAFAGLWSAWGPESVLTCSVVTTAARGGLARVHDRMPLILPAERWDDWLAGGGDPERLLRPLSDSDLEAIEIRAIGPEVGNVRNNGPELLEPRSEVTLF
ncbi:SOS response-associated peptidase [Actinoplanes sp. NPDC023936]|uniref:SOS response-associated peptidase n=1 Tax=Actinoplanes sp. NPDC023936 TaxID=3154910 RepID=UPI0033CD6B59